MKLKHIFVILLTFMLISCATYNGMPVRPPEVAAAPSASASSGSSAVSKNYAVMDVFFATDRKEDKNAHIGSRFSGDRGKLTYGITQVSIPRDHRMGEVESPSILRFQLWPNQEKHVVMLTIENLDKLSYYQAISQRIKDSAKKSAFIFVHGYNVTFEDAARRTGQIYYDLGFDGVAAFYSWPSHGKTLKYTFDEENIAWSQKNIEIFLKDFLEKSDAENVYLIAHSMGNRALTRAYISLIKDKPDLKLRIKEIILAAPDIDADTFKDQIAPAMIQAGNPITLYTSSEDIPLLMSKTIHHSPRAGESGENLVVLPGIETIDATNVANTVLGHSYYADEKFVISDMFYIFNKGLRARERSGLKEIISSDGAYWEFRK